MMEAAWIAACRRETDRNRRREILSGAEAEFPGRPETEMRKKIWEARYDRIDGHDVDYFMRGWINLEALNTRIRLPGERKRIRAAVDEILSDWQFDLCRKYGDIGEKALYDELFNLTLLYIEICGRDRMYNSVLLGLGHITDENRASKIAREIRTITTVIPEKLGIAEEIKPFPEAASDALRYAFPSEAGL